uniref:Phage FDXHR zinc binding domain-containing protein n=1 Tax=uncultured organism TaxID=155900 RepID=A0A7L9QCL3_9ZZZZ|nr:hypothetical protein [uncultured organism]
MAQTYGCSSCDNRWTGLSAAHCSHCHVTFASARLFDLHYTTTGRELNMVCKSPSRMRGVSEVRPGVFGRPTPAIRTTDAA